MITHTPSTDRTPGQSAGGPSGSWEQLELFGPLDQLHMELGSVEAVLALFGAWLTDMIEPGGRDAQ